MKQTIQWKNKSIQIDVGLILILILFGATSCFALYNSFNLIKAGSGSTYLYRQIFWFIVGFAAMFFLSKLQNKKIYSYMHAAYRILMLCLIYLFFSRLLNNFLGVTLPFANETNGAISWFQLPIIGSFQPSEFIKIVLIILVSQIIVDHQNKHPNPTYKDDWSLLWKIIKVLFPPLFLIMMQPDTGVCIIIVFNIFVLLCCSGIRKEYIIAIFAVVILAIAGFLFLYFEHPEILNMFVSSYKLQRIDAWLEPESYIRGSSNQLYTALLSLGSAGLTGYGLQANIISIPEAHTDFIFAAFGQCFGFIGTTFILLLCLLLDIYLCRIAYATKNKKDRFIVIGIIAMLLYQQLQNIGMIVGLLPITGITLPLISYGGSSILSYFISFAIIFNISPATKKTIHLNRRKN